MLLRYDKMPEKQIEKRLRNKINKQGGIAAKFTVPGMTGMPDRLVLLPGGQIVFIELKAPGKKLRPLQQKRFQQLKKLGFRVLKIDSVKDVDDFVREVFK